MSEHDKPDIDDHTGVETTGHDWDGIKELNMPLPKWWLYTFYVSIVWAIGYMIVYPSWPSLSGYYSGLIGYSQRDAVAEDIAEANSKRAVYSNKIAAASFDEIRADVALMEVAQAGGKAAFGDNCAPCHGTGAQGFTGFPNLNDDEWLWGGTLNDIEYTIQHGVRFDGDDDTRLSDMPRFKVDGILDRAQILDVVEHVTKIAGGEADADRAARGAALFADNCAACHGADGTGDRSQGAPNLTDAIWLYGSDKAVLYASISNSRKGVMPAWAGRLDAATIKQLALYVHALGGGE